jgi:Tn3 transposase DDE domain
LKELKSMSQVEFRERTFENQSFRASGLTFVTAAIVHWNTVHLDLAVQHLRMRGVNIPDGLLAHVAPLGWEHIALTGDYVPPPTRPKHSGHCAMFAACSYSRPLSLQFWRSCGLEELFLRYGVMFVPKGVIRVSPTPTTGGAPVAAAA